MVNRIKTSHQEEIKKTNTETVFRLILENDGISRSVISKKTGLSPSTVSIMVDQLIAKGLVKETPDSDCEVLVPGRRPISIRVNPEDNLIIGLEVFEGGIRGGVFNLLKNEIKHIDRMETDMKSDFMGKVVDTIRCLIEGLEGKKFLGIGIGLPAVVDPRNRLLVYSIPLQLKQVSMCEEITNLFKIPVYVESEAKLSGLAENAIYMGNIESFVYIMVDKGIAGCMINAHRVQEGSFGSAGEIGHMSINPFGPQCDCGNRGCLELYASTEALLNNAGDMIKKDNSSIISDMAGGNHSKLTVSMIGDAAEKGDPAAVKLADDAAMYLACGITNIVNILNPEVIIIGGSIMDLGNGFLTNVGNLVKKTALKPYAENLIINYSHFKDSPVALGGALLVLEGEYSKLL